MRGKRKCGTSGKSTPPAKRLTRGACAEAGIKVASPKHISTEDREKREERKERLANRRAFAALPLFHPSSPPTNTVPKPSHPDGPVEDESADKGDAGTPYSGENDDYCEVVAIVLGTVAKSKSNTVLHSPGRMMAIDDGYTGVIQSDMNTPITVNNTQESINSNDIETTQQLDVPQSTSTETDVSVPNLSPPFRCYGKRVSASKWFRKVNGEVVASSASTPTGDMLKNTDIVTRSAVDLDSNHSASRSGSRVFSDPPSNLERSQYRTDFLRRVNLSPPGWIDSNPASMTSSMISVDKEKEGEAPGEHGEMGEQGVTGGSMSVTNEIPVDSNDVASPTVNTVHSDRFVTMESEDRRMINWPGEVELSVDMFTADAETPPARRAKLHAASLNDNNSSTGLRVSTTTIPTFRMDSLDDSASLDGHVLHLVCPPPGRLIRSSSKKPPINNATVSGEPTKDMESGIRRMEAGAVDYAGKNPSEFPRTPRTPINGSQQLNSVARLSESTNSRPSVPSAHQPTATRYIDWYMVPGSVLLQIPMHLSYFKLPKFNKELGRVTFETIIPLPFTYGSYTIGSKKDAQSAQLIEQCRGAECREEFDFLESFSLFFLLQEERKREQRKEKGEGQSEEMEPLNNEVGPSSTRPVPGQ